MSNFLAFGVYPKGGKRAGLVFKKNSNILYRITTLERADLFVNGMYQYASDLGKQKAEREFLLKLQSPRNKSHALEIALMKDKAELRVFEMLDGYAKMKFNWMGTPEELATGLRDFGVMIIALRF